MTHGTAKGYKAGCRHVEAKVIREARALGEVPDEVTS